MVIIINTQNTRVHVRLQMQYTICDIIHLHKIGKLTQAFYINNAYNYDLDGADHIEINIEGKSNSLLSK